MTFHGRGCRGNSIRAPRPAVPALRVGTLNTWGTRGGWASRLPVLRRGFADMGADLLTLQETMLCRPPVREAGPARPDQRASDQRASDQRASDQRASDQRASDQRASDQNTWKSG